MNSVDRPAVIGRDGELARVETFLGQPERWPRTLLLQGEPGIGKTTLWHAGYRSALGRSYRVLSSIATASETNVAFVGLGDVLEGVVHEAVEDLPEPQRRAIRVALLEEESAGPPPDPRALGVAVLNTVRSLARTGPTVVAVDDIHFLDAPTAMIVQFVARRLRDEPVAFLLAVRAGLATEYVAELERAMEEGRFERIALGPLTLGALHELLHSRLGTSFPRPVMRRLHETSRGNPLFALEIARALEQHGGDVSPGEPLPVPHDLQALLQSRLDGLPKETRDLLLVVSAAAEPTTGLLEGGLGRDPTEALRPALNQHLVEWTDDRLWFTHPLLASTVYSSAGPSERREVHRRLADVVSTPEERARHLALAAPRPDPEVASELDAVAEAAAARGAPAAAAELAELAIDLTPSENHDEIVRRRHVAATHHYTCGRLDRSRELFTRLLAEVAPGTNRAAILLNLAWVEEDLRVAARYGEMALSEAGGDPQTAAGGHHWLAFAGMGGGSILGGRRHAQAAVDAADRTGNPVLLVSALSASILADALAGEMPDAAMVERGFALEGQLVGVPIYYPPRLALACWLFLTSRLDEARLLLKESYARAQDTGDEVMQSATLLHWTEQEVRAGAFARARDLAEEAWRVVEQIQFHAREGPVLYATALSASRLGMVKVTRTAAGRGIENCEHYGLYTFAQQNRAALGFLELSLGRMVEATDHLRRIPEWLRERGFGEPSLCLATPDAIESLVAIGDFDDARRELEWLEERGEAVPGPWGRTTAARSRGLLLAAEGDVDEALRHFDRALTLHRTLPEPFELGRTLLSLGTTLRRARKRRQAREVLGRSLLMFERLESPLWAERARQELARIGGRAPSGPDLTGTERRVAELVATGLSNKEVAAELYVSVHTVETHLSKIYAKLGVRSRSELASRLAGRPHEPGS